MRKIYFILLMVAVVVTCGCNESGRIQVGQQPVRMSRSVQMEIDYLLYLPADYGKVKKDWPLIVYLHGAGERGSDINKVKANGPAMLVEQGKDMPFIIVSPQCPEGKWWANYVEKIMALIDETAECYDVDESRIYLTGLSMGGYGTWSIAARYPERFAAIAPICGGGIPFTARNLKNMPTWAFHGAKDEVVPLVRSQEMVDAINKAGGNAKLTVYPEADHDSWTEAYNNEELYKWFLEHTNNE